MGLGVRIPKLFAIFDGRLGRTAAGERLRGRSDWKRFLAEGLPAEFVVKPALGVHGRALNIYRRSGRGFLDVDGRACTPGAIYDSMTDDRDYDRFIVQERLANHPELTRLSGIGTLQTLRAITLVPRGGEPQILFAVQKICQHEGASDNFHFGRTGNMVASVDAASGVVERAVTGSAEGFSVHRVERHPKTGLKLEGFEVPCWNDVRVLVLDAASKFLPIRTIGWDVALTPDGPVVVEGNMWWHSDHHNVLGQTQRFLEFHARELGAPRHGPDVRPRSVRA